MHRFLVILLQILLAKVLLAEGLVVEDNKKPIVYTGTATINRDGIKTKFITRLHLLKIGVNPTGAPDYYATVVYYLGDDASNEYSTHSYGYTTVNPETQEMLLISNANPKFPVISLRFNDDASLAEGVINISSENVGSLALKSGWTYDSAGVETKFGGVYQSKCKSAYSSLVSQTRWITIAPNRTSPFGLNDIEAFDNDMYYSVSGYSSYSVRKDEYVSSLHYPNSRTLLLQRKLILQANSASYRCTRADAIHMTCENKLVGICLLAKVAEVHTSISTKSEIPVARVSFQEQSFVGSGGLPACSQWQKTYKGFIFHRIGQRFQPIKIQMSPLSRISESGVQECLLSVTARLGFGVHNWQNQALEFPMDGAIFFTFNKQVIRPDAANVILQSSAPSEITLSISQGNSEKFNFIWMSNIVGHFGVVMVSENPEIANFPEVDEKNSVPSLCGTFAGPYKLTGYKTREIIQAQCFARSSGFPGDPNPFTSIDLEGFWGNFFSLNVNDFLLPPNSLEMRAHYDYYTNYFMYGLLGISKLIGQMTIDGFEYRTQKPVGTTTVKGVYVPKIMTREPSL